MAITRAKFQAIAANLINNKFVDLASDCTITRTTSFNRDTDLPATEQQTILMIRVEFEEKQYNNSSIKVGDYKLIGVNADLEWPPTPDTCDAFHDGIYAEVKGVKIDTAKAAIVLHVRAK